MLRASFMQRSNNFMLTRSVAALASTTCLTSRSAVASSATTLSMKGAAAASAATTFASPFLAESKAYHGGALNQCRSRQKTVRNATFKKVDEKDIAFFRSIFGPDPDEISRAVIVAPSPDMDAYAYDWFRDYKGEPPVALLPKTTEQVSKILKYCYDNTIAVVPAGGNTGFVGGAVPVFDEIVISLKRMNKIHNIDEVSGTLRCEAGCILEVLDNAVQEKGFLMPVDLGAKGSCFIGGNVATAAGGLRYARYGSMQANTLGLTAVLANGEVLDLLNDLKKDNTGYKLHQLFIGSEGTLGIITEVAIQLPAKPAAINTCFFGAPSWEAFLQLFMAARRELGEILSACELIDGEALDLILDMTKAQGVVSPLPERRPYYLLVETNGSNKEHDSAKLFAFLEKIVGDGSGGVIGTVAETAQQSKHIWSMRELCATAPPQTGAYVRWYDISLPGAEIKNMIEKVRAALKAKGYGPESKTPVDAICFAHFMDNNAHVNAVLRRGYDQAVVDVVDEALYGMCRENGWSYSGEHGTGVQKRSRLPDRKSELVIEKMRSVKNLFDPKGIMNPYKLLVMDQ